MEAVLQVYLPKVLAALCRAYHVPELEIDLPGSINRDYQGLFDRYSDLLIENNFIYSIECKGQLREFSITRKKLDFIQEVAHIRTQAPFSQSDNKNQLYLTEVILRAYFNRQVPTGKIIRKWFLPSETDIESIVKYKQLIYLLVAWKSEEYLMLVYNTEGQLMNQFTVGNQKDGVGNFVIYQGIIYIVFPSQVTTISLFSLEGEPMGQQKFIASEDEAIMPFDFLTIFEDKLYAVDTDDHRIAELFTT